MILHEAFGTLPSGRVSLRGLASLYFAQTVVEVTARLSERGKSSLEGRIRDALKSDVGFAPLYLEMEIARRLFETGFDVAFVDLEGKARFDLQFSSADTEGEVECKSLSVDAGRKIHQRDFYRFIDGIGPQLFERAATGANEVLFVFLDDRLPARTADQQALRKAAIELLQNPDIEAAQGDFFSIRRDSYPEFARGCESKSTDVYRAWCDLYGENCHVSGATLDNGHSVVVMRSGREDDHSKPLLEALKTAAGQFSKTKPTFIAVQFDDISTADLLSPNIRRRTGLLSAHLFHHDPSIAGIYFCVYGGLNRRVLSSGVNEKAAERSLGGPGRRARPGW
jgi:hypothetical protein